MFGFSLFENFGIWNWDITHKKIWNDNSNFFFENTNGVKQIISGVSLPGQRQVIVFDIVWKIKKMKTRKLVEKIVHTNFRIFRLKFFKNNWNTKNSLLLILALACFDLKSSNNSYMQNNKTLVVISWINNKQLIFSFGYYVTLGIWHWALWRWV